LLLLFTDQREHRTQALVAEHFTVMRMGEFVELPVLEIRPS
jgi:hypothetical protein